MADAPPVNPSSSSRWAVVVAAGSGSRFGGPKQLARLGEHTVLHRSLSVALEVCDGAVVVASPSLFDATVEALGTLSADPRVLVTPGGPTRSESVRRGLAQVPTDASSVLIHDAARPMASSDLFRRVATALDDGADVVIPVVAVVDSIRHRRFGPVDRDELVLVQTPQGAVRSILEAAHAGGNDAADDASLCEAAGATVTLVDGERENIKITEAADIDIVRAWLGL